LVHLPVASADRPHADRSSNSTPTGAGRPAAGDDGYDYDYGDGSGQH